MRALLVAKPGCHFEHQRQAMRALSSGMQQHGIEAHLKPSSARSDYDFIVSWGDKFARKREGMPHLILECGYINAAGGSYSKNRLRFISTSWNRRHGLSDWRWAQEASGDRWDALGIELQPWRMGGEHALLLEQLPGDKAAPDVRQFRQSVEGFCDSWRWPLRVRPHPKDSPRVETLSEDLAGARCAITWCSTAAVEAVIAGVPTYTLGEGSIAAPVTRSLLLDTPYRGERTRWAHRLAYRQWSMAELADGSAWPHILAGLA